VADGRSSQTARLGCTPVLRVSATAVHSSNTPTHDSPYTAGDVRLIEGAAKDPERLASLARHYRASRIWRTTSATCAEEAPLMRAFGRVPPRNATIRRISSWRGASATEAVIVSIAS
jgi:hypothetical protein